MCGIVGLFIKDAKLEPQLGELTATMLGTMCERGPDSAGFAVYGPAQSGRAKITLQSPNPDRGLCRPDGGDLQGHRRRRQPASASRRTRVLSVPADKAAAAREALRAGHPRLRIMSTGEAIEIYKEVGYPTQVAERFDLAQDAGHARHRPYAHGDGKRRHDHRRASVLDRPRPVPRPQRLAVEPHNLRRDLIHDGMTFETENDTEVAAAYLSWRMNQGMNLGEALEKSLDDLDGFFTFVVGTKNGFGVLRDPIACKPAVMAETDEYVAFGSEYRALAGSARHRRRARLGARTRDRLFLGALIEHADCRSRYHVAARAERSCCTSSPPAPTRRSGRSSTRRASTPSPSASMRRSTSRSRAASAITAPA